MYTEDEMLPLSGIQHYAFCPRQWYLIHVEQLWEENHLTAEGHLLHEKVHQPEESGRRGNVITLRSVPLAPPHLASMDTPMLWSYTQHRSPKGLTSITPSTQETGRLYQSSTSGDDPSERMPTSYSSAPKLSVSRKPMAYTFLEDTSSMVRRSIGRKLPSTLSFAPRPYRWLSRCTAYTKAERAFLHATLHAVAPALY